MFWKGEKSCILRRKILRLMILLVPHTFPLLHLDLDKLPELVVLIPDMGFLGELGSNLVRALVSLLVSWIYNRS